MLEKFVELFPLLVLWAVGWMLPASALALVFVHLNRHGYLRPFADLFHAARRLSLVGWLCVAPLVVGLVGYASTKNDGGSTNDAPTRLSAPRRMLRSPAEDWLIPPTPVTPAEIAAGYRAPADGAAGIVPAPEGAVTNARWCLRGAHDDAFRLDPADWRFPLRDGAVTGVTVLARGEVRPDVGTPSFPVSPVGGVSLLPASRRDVANSLFWHALSPSNSLLLTWENALVGRDPNCQTNLQAELYADGRFAWRTDGGSQLYLPVFDFDWDGDGLVNSVDPDPLVAGPDAHGTNAEWYRVVCTNAFTEATGSEPEDSDAPRLLPEGVAFRENVTSNAYYFVDVVAEQGPAPIYFTAGQRSDLGSPILVATPGVTNRMPLQIGIEYTVTSAIPFSVGLPMGGFAELLRDEPTSKTVKWPLEFTFKEELGRNGVRTYSVGVDPYDPGGRFSWETEDGSHGRASLMSSDPSMPECGCVSTANGVVTFCCSGSCTCNGTCQASGFYYVAGSIFGVTGGVCRCGFYDPEDDEPPTYELEADPSFSVSFSESAVLFEESYQNVLGQFSPRRSTRVRLTVSAYGGSNGGSLMLSSENLQKLKPVAEGPIDLPAARTLSPGESFHTTCIYEAEEASFVSNDIRVGGTFAEDGTSLRIEANAELTATRVEIEADDLPLQNPSPNRHEFGVHEKVYCRSYPAGVEWTADDDIDDGLSTVLVYNNSRFFCPWTGGNYNLKATLGTVEMRVPIAVLEPAVECRAAMWLDVPGAQPGVAGMVGMSLALYLQPSSVSFSFVQLQEIPEYVAIPPSGYFAVMPGLLRATHDEGSGAGVWKVPWPRNGGIYWTDDAAQMPRVCPPLPDTQPPSWSDGTVRWMIPVGWGDGTTVKVRMSPNPTMQVYHMSADGTLSVSKYQHTIMRSVDGRVWLDGSRVNAWWNDWW